MHARCWYTACLDHAGGNGYHTQWMAVAAVAASLYRAGHNKYYVFRQKIVLVLDIENCSQARKAVEYDDEYDDDDDGFDIPDALF